MLLNRGYFADKKILITGLAGMGKTYLAHYLSKFFRCMVYTQHQDDIEKYWKKEKIILAKTKDFIHEFPFWCVVEKKLSKSKKINCFIVDDADLIFRTHFDTSSQLRDLVINNRHYGLTLIFVSRRPQDIPTRVYGIFEILALFQIESPQVVSLLNRYYEGLGDLTRNLPYNSHEFIIKHAGQKPIKARV